MKTLYDELQVAETASTDTIRTAYRRLAQRVHPDKNPAPGAAERFRNLHSAYVALAEEGSRQRYDLFLKQHRAAEGRAARARQARVAPRTASIAMTASGAQLFAPEVGGSTFAEKVGMFVLIGLFGAASLAWQLL